MTPVPFPDPFEHESVQTVCKRALEARKRISADDLRRYPKLLSVVNYFVDNYRGNSSFVLQQQRRMWNDQKLTVNQLQVCGNVMIEEYRAKLEEPDLFIDFSEITDEDDSTDPVVPSGTYTIRIYGDNGASSDKTIRLRDNPFEDAPEGSQIASYLAGPDNTRDYLGFAFVVGKSVRPWKKFREGYVEVKKALELLLQMPQAGWILSGEAWALKSGRCFRCGRPLTRLSSISAGLGPVCAEKLGLEITDPEVHPRHEGDDLFDEDGEDDDEDEYYGEEPF